MHESIRCWMRPRKSGSQQTPRGGRGTRTAGPPKVQCFSEQAFSTPPGGKTVSRQMDSTRGTDGSNPSSSSRESVYRAKLPCDFRSSRSEFGAAHISGVRGGLSPPWLSEGLQTAGLPAM
jgi:hypothetical protein